MNLTKKTIASFDKPGQYGFGDHLYLRVGPNGAKSWIFRFRQPSTVVQLGLGAAGKESEGRLSVELARAKIRELQIMRARGTCPRAERRRLKKGDTFAQIMEQVIEKEGPSWKGGTEGKSAQQWRQSLKDHAGKLLGMRVAHITQADVLAILKPIWGTETAGRVQNRIEQVLRSAKAQGAVTTNVAVWKDGLDQILSAKAAKKAEGEGHTSLPHADLPAFIEMLRGANGKAVKALLFLILTATRAGETLGALKTEINRETREWTIPAERMKAGQKHVVPLTEQAMEIVNEMWDEAGDHLFANNGKPLGATALRDKLQAPKKKGGFDMRAVATVHGFRATFSTWFQERTTVKAEIVEMCLAHAVKAELSINADVRAAYARGKCIDMRRAAMEAWSNFCFGIENAVTLRLVA